MMHISNSGSLQQSADGYQNHADMMRVQQHRRHDAVFDQWAQGCGVIEHTAATQLAVFELAANLEETGKINNKQECYETLIALDEIVNQGLWLVVHMTYAKNIYLDGRD